VFFGENNLDVDQELALVAPGQAVLESAAPLDDSVEG
jgi:hypothetical protein